MKRAATIALITALLLVVAFYWWREANVEIYKTYSSPGGRYRIEVWRYPELYASPGDSGGAPGFVRLVDVESGKQIYRKATDMVQVIEYIDWSPRIVNIRLFAEWTLPK